MLFQGRGIDLSAVGRGQGLIQGQTDDPNLPSDGLWSLNDEEYRSLPATITRFGLVGPPPPPPERH